MKKLLSMALALAMICSLSVTAFAVSNPEPGIGGNAGTDYSTTVTYTGQATEEYTVTVPATLVPGGSGNVVVTGTWSSQRYVSVSAAVNLYLRNGDDSKPLDFTFATDKVLTVYGSDTESINVTEAISVADFADGEAPLFGTWAGTITYIVGMGTIGGSIVPV